MSKTQCANLTAIVEITSTRDIGNETSTEKRYYISSLSSSAKSILKYTRQHWGIENQLHWVSDMSFNDDQCRIRKGNAPKNMAILRKVALNLLNITKNNPKYKRCSLKRMRKLAGWGSKFMSEVLTAKF